MSKYYLITLTPIDKFFFGGEITFIRGSEKKKKDMTEDEKILKDFDDAYSSYIVKSNLFPQQTSLLGMLRFLILSNNEELFANNKIQQGKQGDVAKLIGEKSFQLNEDFKEMDFKSIKKIHPCFIQRKTENENRWSDLIFAPMDYVRKNKEKDTEREIVPLKISFQSGNSLLDNVKQKKPVIIEYKAKEGIQPFLTDGTVGWKISEIFQEDARIGINRNFNGKTETNAFYKQIFYRFTDKYKFTESENGESIFKSHQLRFAFYAELEYDFPEGKNHIVSLGGDNSRFSLQAETVGEIPGFILPKDENFENCDAKLILTTEAFIEDDAMNHCLFSINETVPFRFLTSTVYTENYYNFLGDGRLQRSEKKYNLYKRGSVFYFDNQEDNGQSGLTKFKEAVNNKKLFQQIGYNNYQTIIK